MRPRVLFVLLMLVSSDGFGQWDFGQSFPINFAEAPLSKNLAVDADGNIHAAFRASAFVRYHMRQESSGEWSTPEIVNDTASMGFIGEIAIGWNPLTEQPIVAYEANARVWFAARQANGTWTRRMLGDSTEEASAPDVAVNSAGVIYVVYITHDQEYQLDYGYFDGVTWEFNDIEADIGDFGSGASPRVAVDENDAGHVVFRGGNFGGYMAQYATNQAGGNDDWTVTTLSVPHAESYPGDVAVDANGGVHCVSSGSEGFGIPRPVYYHYRTPEGAWSFGTVATGISNASEPVIALDATGHPHVMCLEISGNFYTGTLFYSAAPEWQAQVVYGSTDGAVCFAIDGEGFGRVFIPSVDGTVYYLESEEPLVSPNWGPEISIEPDTLDFGEAPIGDTTIGLIRFENPNEDVLRITGLTLESPVFHGPDEWNTIELMWGQSTSIEIRFEPTAEVTYTAIAVVVSNAITSPDTVYITGAGDVGASAPEAPLPTEFALHAVYPNPFNSSVTIDFDLARETEVSLSVFDVLGRRVETLVNQRMGAGAHSMQWDAGDRATGVYLFRLDAGGKSFVRKAAFLK
jgi:hypothetical protein